MAELTERERITQLENQNRNLKVAAGIAAAIIVALLAWPMCRR